MQTLELHQLIYLCQKSAFILAVTLIFYRNLHLCVSLVKFSQEVPKISCSQILVYDRTYTNRP